MPLPKSASLKGKQVVFASRDYSELNALINKDVKSLAKIQKALLNPKLLTAAEVAVKTAIITTGTCVMTHILGKPTNNIGDIFAITSLAICAVGTVVWGAALGVAKFRAKRIRANLVKNGKELHQKRRLLVHQQVGLDAMKAFEQYANPTPVLVSQVVYPDNNSVVITFDVQMEREKNPIVIIQKLIRQETERPGKENYL